VVSNLFLRHKVEEFFSSFCIFFKGKKGRQHLDRFLKLFVWNLKKIVIYMSSSQKNTQVEKNHPKQSSGSGVIVDLKSSVLGLFQ
jgi:hypothetical protein